ncbi:MAG: hypothetical protein ACRD4S_13020 [Candidatus Acidiferrales bacterium]
MTGTPWLSFDPRLSWDGLLTFFGGVLAFFAILFQVRHADRGLKSQMDVEKRARNSAADERRRAVATGLLFEIDDHYRSNIRDVLQFLDGIRRDSAGMVIRPISADPFPMYIGSVEILGELPPTLVEAIVHYYGLLGVYVSRLAKYLQAFDYSMQGQSAQAKTLMDSQTPLIKREGEAITQLTYPICGLLSEFVGVEFSRIGVANDSNVNDDAREALKASLARLGMEIEDRPRKHAETH